MTSLSSRFVVHLLISEMGVVVVWSFVGMLGTLNQSLLHTKDSNNGGQYFN